MKRFSVLIVLLIFAFIGIASAQNNDNRIFDWTPANGQSILMDDMSFSGHKKANVEVNTVKCVDHCDLLNATPNP